MLSLSFTPTYGHSVPPVASVCEKCCEQALIFRVLSNQASFQYLKGEKYILHQIFFFSLSGITLICLLVQTSRSTRIIDLLCCGSSPDIALLQSGLQLASCWSCLAQSVWIMGAVTCSLCHRAHVKNRGSVNSCNLHHFCDMKSSLSCYPVSFIQRRSDFLRENMRVKVT